MEVAPRAREGRTRLGALLPAGFHPLPARLCLSWRNESKAVATADVICCAPASPELRRSASIRQVTGLRVVALARACPIILRAERSPLIALQESYNSEKFGFAWAFSVA